MVILFIIFSKASLSARSFLVFRKLFETAIERPLLTLKNLTRGFHLDSLISFASSHEVFYKILSNDLLLFLLSLQPYMSIDITVLVFISCRGEPFLFFLGSESEYHPYYGKMFELLLVIPILMLQF